MRFLMMFLATCLPCSCDQDEPRTWTDRSGNFSVVASLVVDAADPLGGPVRLVRSDGKEIQVALDKLDDKSQSYVRKKRGAAKKAARDRSRTTDSDAAEMPETQDESAAANQTGTTPAAEAGEDTPAADDSCDWSQWRGPGRDGISSETGLMDSWPDSGPDLLWSASGLGSAMSSVAISRDQIYTMGNRGGGEHLIALNMEDGKELWATRVGSGGESNSTPTVDGDFVFTVGRGGDLACTHARTGELQWQKNFERDFGGRMMSSWGYSESPLVDGDRLVCTPGGPDAMIAALDKKTGDVIWQTPMRPGGNRGTDGAGYASVVISNGGGVKQYITLVGRGLISVAAKDGRPLWHYEKIANGTANIPTPIVEGDYVFCSTGYGDGGTALLKLSGSRGQVRYNEVYYLRANQVQNHHGGMIKIGDHVYMGEGHNEGFPMCIHFMTGRTTWPKQRGAGKGSAAIVAADGHLYFRYQNGIMALIEADPREYRLKGSFRIATVKRESWPHPVICGGKLFLRDQDQLHCYDIAKP